MDTAYSDLDVQNVVTTLDDPDASHTTLLEEFQALNNFEPLGGLARQEVAELVALYVQVELTYKSPSAENAQMSMASELSFDSTDNTFNDLAEDVSESDVVTGIDARNKDVIDIDVLTRTTVSAIQPEADSANALGAGGDVERSERWVPYRATYGRGPVVDRHDELFVHASLDERGTPGEFQWEHYAQLVWDVQERE